MTDATVDTSVVIGFRNWGEDRIRLAGQSIQSSFGSFSGELIISDYGSDDPGPARAVAEELGAAYVLTEGDPNWSRSRALNAGFAVSNGEVLISTDADMLFSPTSMARITEVSKLDPLSALFLQCRDLPPHLDSAAVASEGVDWDRFERESRLRPRWGMGGMMAVSRAGFEAVRGFDERLHTYGGEDLDFAQRLRRAGYKTVWLDEPGVRMYHMWHPSSRTAAETTPEGKSAVDFNKEVVYKDKSFVRNTVAWRHAPAARTPLVTVAIVTHNRASLLREAIQATLAQTVQDLEIVIVDDGSTDDTEAVVRSFDDARIRYFYQDQAGISVARNRALDETRGTYTAVLDDDDLMPAQRLEWQLEALDGIAAGTVGSFVNFDDETGKMGLIISQVPTVAAVEQKGGAPGHGTWLVKTDVLRRFRYDEQLTSGVDNNLMLRMVRCGLQFKHTGKVVLLRRTHSLQVTQTDNANQGAAAARAHTFFTFSMSEWSHKKYEEERKERGTYPPGLNADELIAEATPFLPDHLIARDVQLASASSRQVRALGLEGELGGVVTYRDGELQEESLTLHNATYADLAAMRSAGIDWTVFSTRPAPEAPGTAPFDPEAWLRLEIAALLTDPSRPLMKFAVVGQGTPDPAPGTVLSRDVAFVSHDEQSASYRIMAFDTPIAASTALLTCPAPAFLVGPFTVGGDE